MTSKVAGMCPLCKKFFTGVHGNQKYCSTKCRLEAAAQQHEGKKYLPTACAVCGGVFTPKSKDHILCSPQCRLVKGRQHHPDRGFNLPKPTVGAMSEMLVCTDLLKEGYHVFRAVSPACPCDLIALKDETVRVEVKTGWSTPEGALIIQNQE